MKDLLLHKQNITKSLIISGILALSPSSSKANTTGIYVGAALGGAALTGKSNLNIIREIPLNPGVGTPQNFNLSISDKNVAGDIFLGYGRRFNCFWAAIEAMASFTSINSKPFFDIFPQDQAANGQFLSVKTTFGWGGNLNLGYYINQTTKLYLKLGVECRRFRVNFNGSTDPTDPNIINVNKSYNSTAFVPGLGIETELTPRLSLRTEYRTALHQAKTVQVANSATQSTTIKTRPTIHFFNLGLTFKI